MDNKQAAQLRLHWQKSVIQALQADLHENAETERLEIGKENHRTKNIQSQTWVVCFRFQGKVYNQHYYTGPTGNNPMPRPIPTLDSSLHSRMLTLQKELSKTTTVLNSYVSVLLSNALAIKPNLEGFKAIFPQPVHHILEEHVPMLDFNTPVSDEAIAQFKEANQKSLQMLSALYIRKLIR